MDKIICLGKNYLDHAEEMGDFVPEKPVLFLKPPSVASTVKEKGDIIEIAFPWERGEIHHECEIVLLLNQEKEIEGVTLGLDMTLREEQSRLKKKGHPWEVSKVFKNSAIIGPWLKVAELPVYFHQYAGNYLEAEFTFQLDQVVLQVGKGKDMRLSPKECLKYAAEYFPLCEGDVVFTGTPRGVGPVQPGQLVEMKWANQILYRIRFI